MPSPSAYLSAFRLLRRRIKFFICGIDYSLNTCGLPSRQEHTTTAPLYFTRFRARSRFSFRHYILPEFLFVLIYLECINICRNIIVLFLTHALSAACLQSTSWYITTKPVTKMLIRTFVCCAFIKNGLVNKRKKNITAKFLCVLFSSYADYDDNNTNNNSHAAQ